MRIEVDREYLNWTRNLLAEDGIEMTPEELHESLDSSCAQLAEGAGVTKQEICDGVVLIGQAYCTLAKCFAKYMLSRKVALRSGVEASLRLMGKILGVPPELADCLIADSLRLGHIVEVGDTLQLPW